MRLLLAYCFARGALRALVYPEQTDRLRLLLEDRRWMLQRGNIALCARVYGENNTLGYLLSLAMAIQLTREKMR